MWFSLVCRMYSVKSVLPFQHLSPTWKSPYHGVFRWLYIQCSPNATTNRMPIIPTDTRSSQEIYLLSHSCHFLLIHFSFFTVHWLWAILMLSLSISFSLFIFLFVSLIRWVNKSNWFRGKIDREDDPITVNWYGCCIANRVFRVVVHLCVLEHRMLLIA